MITKDLLKNCGACLFIANDGAPRDALDDALEAGSVGMSPRAFAALESVSLDDRLWVLCHVLHVRNETAARTFAIDSAALVSHLAGNERDQAEHARLVADLRRIFALPEERSTELRSWDANRNAAARDATARDAAAWGAAWGAAWYAAWGDAWATARDAARATGYAAAWGIDDTRVIPAGLLAGNAAWDTALRESIARALKALGPDAEGWS